VAGNGQAIGEPGPRDFVRSGASVSLNGSSASQYEDKAILQ